MGDNPFIVDLWNSFWEYVYSWVRLDRERTFRDRYWTWVDFFENFWDIQQTEGGI